ncbi:MAG: LamG domain-containing protein [Myxococcales bacterium]|nr:LamG domain-containing protein [Myxococcales bacterium]
MRPHSAPLVVGGLVALAAACTEFSTVTTGGDAGEELREASVPDNATSPSVEASAPEAGADTSTPRCDEQDLVGRWRLDEGSGTRISDCTSSALVGTLYGGTWVEGRKGRKALSFVGGDTGARIDLGDPAALKLEGGMTLSAWINVRTVASYGRIFAKSASDGDRGWDLFVDVDGSLDFRVASGPNDYVFTSLRTFPLGQWKHVAAVFDPGIAVRLYVDGKVVASTTVGIPAAQRNSTRPAYIGARADCCTVDGALEDVRIYRRALTATELDLLFKANGP